MNGVVVLRDMDAVTQRVMGSLSSRIVSCREGMRCSDWSRVMIFAGARDSGRVRAMRFQEISLLTTAVSVDCGHKSRCIPRPLLLACFITAGCRDNTASGQAALTTCCRRPGSEVDTTSLANFPSTFCTRLD